MHRRLITALAVASAAVLALGGLATRPARGHPSVKEWDTIIRTSVEISPGRTEITGGRSDADDFRVKVSSRPTGLRVNGYKHIACIRDGEPRILHAKPITLVTPATREIRPNFHEPDRCSATVVVRVKRSEAPDHGRLDLVLQALPRGR